MNILKTAKLLTLGVGKSIGVMQALRRSDWRKNQLLILAYHGVSQDDEHLWDPDLFFSPDYFRTRMQLLKDDGCHVLQLSDALQRLWTKTLPPCSVVLTFDDGGCDFYRHAFPILREFGWTATVYLTSYYCNYNRPVFDVMCSYLLWKGRNSKLNLGDVISGCDEFDLGSKGNRDQILATIRLFARQTKYSAQQKDELLNLIAERLCIDYETILAKRILHLLSPEEIAKLVAEGVDIQLHTHRHHAPQKRESFLVELKENSAFISKFTKLPRHFAYPHGSYEKCYDAWLSSFHVTSATTCKPGLATNDSNPYNLPRLVDTSSLGLLELEGWISGFSKFFPRKYRSEVSLIPPFYY
jgi:peptidoglycan/xylan/chitin deacetylase (PgdA/CDA1 family)